MRYTLVLSFIAIFLSSQATLSQTPTATPAASRGYVLGPGDEISVKVLGEEQFGFNATVDEDGMLAVPFAETSVIAKCRSERDVRADVIELLTKFLKEPHVNLQVTKRIIHPATVYGEVVKPMEFELRRKATLIELLANAGGAKDEAGGDVLVFRPIKPVCGETAGNWRSNPENPEAPPVKIFSLADMSKGGEEVNPIIYPGDVIVVQKASPVFITGEVMAPQGIYLKGGMKLTEAIAKVGGFRREAKLKEIQIQRRVPNTDDLEYISVNYELIKTKQQPDIALMPYDIILVDTKKDSLGMSIFKFALGLAKTGATALSTGTGYRVLY